MIEPKSGKPWLARHRGSAYAIAILSVAIAVVVTAIMSNFLASEPIGLLLLSAVIATAWLGGFGPALLTIALALLAWQYDIVPPAGLLVWKKNLLEVDISDAPRFGLFVTVSLIVSFVIAAHSNATEALRHSRDELQASIEGLRHTISALQKTEMYLSEAQRLKETGSFGWNVARGEIFWSDQTYRIFGVDRAAEPTHEFILQRTHPDDRINVQAMIEKTTGDNSDFEDPYRLSHPDGLHTYRLLMPDGSMKHIHLLAHATKNMSGEVEFFGVLTDVTAATESERKLRLSETYLAESQHLSHTSSFAWDERRKEFIYVSDELLHLFGFEQGKESLVLKNYHDRLHPEDLPSLIHATRRAVIDKTDFDVPYRIRLPDGITKHVRTVGHPILDTEGEVIQLVGTNIDITEQYEANEELQKALNEIKTSQDHLQLVIDTIPTLVWRAATDGVPDFLNKQALRYTGLAAGEIELDWRRAFHPDDKKDVFVKWAAIREAGKRGRLEGRLLRLDGGYRWFQFDAEPLCNEFGNIVKWYGSATDIEERKLAELSLRESEQRFRDYAETASDWLWETGPDHRIITVSENINVAGLPSFRLQGVTRWEVASDLETEPEKWRRHREALDARRPFRDFVYGVINESGAQIYIRTSGKPVFDVEGRFLGHRGTAADTTASIRAEQAENALHMAHAELAHVTRVTMLGELTASIAHEVNQPLAAAVANGQASLRSLNGEQPDLAAARRSLEWVINDGCRASDVVRRVRALAKKSYMETVRLDLNQVVNEAIRLVERKLIEHRVLLKTELAPALPEILGDRVQLQQVVINLFMNGIEAMEPITDRPGELLVRSSNDDTGHVVLSVTDNGIGISAENANRLFNAFFTTKSSGLGMGLSVCRSIVEAHGGRMSALSNEGPGATFRLALPPHREVV
jgi:PAS domain S-box-containing protein